MREEHTIDNLFERTAILVEPTFDRAYNEIAKTLNEYTDTLPNESKMPSDHANDQPFYNVIAYTHKPPLKLEEQWAHALQDEFTNLIPQSTTLITGTNPLANSASTHSMLEEFRSYIAQAPAQTRALFLLDKLERDTVLTYLQKNTNVSI